MRRYRPLVVHNVEDDWWAEDAGEVQSVMVVPSALAPSPIHVIVTSSLLVGRGHGDPYGLAELSANWTGHGDVTSLSVGVVDRHLPPLHVVLDVAYAVADHTHHVSPSYELCAWLAIGREDPVLALQRHRLGDGDSLLASDLM